ncbi:uncharacterized protein LY89DRAFT_318436 [Mollisia scopiformis]|uniref:Uncharacterized protein n=1 Tax=Mollisia scopiformis TaxID=149040 RepID=A0A132B9G1_MOLSC|nr:uncharacterized protein LY89DRAFT_318436 [Mollisia scopiformis]KUJ09042.1 hypothetical protein LY89DRAFT_318436 [Mollisia scopiformis]
MRCADCILVNNVANLQIFSVLSNYPVLTIACSSRSFALSFSSFILFSSLSQCEAAKSRYPIIV